MNDWMNYVNHHSENRSDGLKDQYLLDIKVVVEMMKISSELVFNWDHTGMGNWKQWKWKPEMENAWKWSNCHINVP